MDATNITRELIRSAKQIAHDEFDAPNIEVILAVFYRLCIEHDRAFELGLDHGDPNQQDWPH